MDAAEWGAILVALLGSGLAGALINGYIAARKTGPEIRQIDATTDKSEAEAAQVISQAWSSLLQPLRDEVGSLRKRVNDLEIELQSRDAQRDRDRERIQELEQKVHILEDQLLEMGVHPKTRPTPPKEIKP